VEVDLVFIGVVTFYPASGWRDTISGALTYTGSSGYAWSCAITGAYGYNLGFNITVAHPAYGSYRAYGFPVRCVQNLLLFKFCCYSHWVEDDLVFIGVVTIYPASGFRYRESGAFNDTASYGCTWSCAVAGVYGCFLGFNSTSVSPMNSNYRAYGFPVRCVQNLLICLVL
jgi:hypothetical protein